MSRQARISFGVVKAWEEWIIDVDDDAPQELTPEWLEGNEDKWSLSFLTDSGDSGREEIEVERQNW